MKVTSKLSFDSILLNHSLDHYAKKNWWKSSVKAHVYEDLFSETKKIIFQIKINKLEDAGNNSCIIKIAYDFINKEVIAKTL